MSGAPVGRIGWYMVQQGGVACHQIKSIVARIQLTKLDCSYQALITADWSEELPAGATVRYRPGEIGLVKSGLVKSAAALLGSDFTPRCEITM